MQSGKKNPVESKQSAEEKAEAEETRLEKVAEAKALVVAKAITAKADDIFIKNKYALESPEKTERIAEAKKLYEEAGEKGDPRGFYELGMMNLKGAGSGVVDYSEAEQWFQKAASKKYPPALHQLGEIRYEAGDDKEALEYFEEASLLGYVLSHGYVATIYQKDGVEHNDQKAADYYRNALENWEESTNPAKCLVDFHKQGKGEPNASFHLCVFFSGSWLPPAFLEEEKRSEALRKKFNEFAKQEKKLESDGHLNRISFLLYENPKDWEKIKKWLEPDLCRYYQDYQLHVQKHYAKTMALLGLLTGMVPGAQEIVMRQLGEPGQFPEERKKALAEKKAREKEEKAKKAAKLQQKSEEQNAKDKARIEANKFVDTKPVSSEYDDEAKAALKEREINRAADSFLWFKPLGEGGKPVENKDDKKKVQESEFTAPATKGKPGK